MPLATPVRRMPRPDAVRDLMSNMIGKPIEVRARQEFNVNDDGTAFSTAVLIEDGGAVAGAIVADLEFASFAGASVVLIPKAAADDSIRSGALSEKLTEQYREIATAITTLLNGPTVATLRIRNLEAGVPAEAGDLIIKAAGRRTFDVTFRGYGTGALALYTI